ICCSGSNFLYALLEFSTGLCQVKALIPLLAHTRVVLKEPIWFETEVLPPDRSHGACSNVKANHFSFQFFTFPGDFLKGMKSKPSAAEGLIDCAPSQLYNVVVIGRRIRSQDELPYNQPSFHRHEQMTAALFHICPQLAHEGMPRILVQWTWKANGCFFLQSAIH